MFEFSFILTILLIVWLVRMSNRLSALEKKVYESPMRATSPYSSPSTVSGFQPAPTISMVPLPQTQPSGYAEPLGRDSRQSGGFVEWLKEDWMLKVGGGLILIGFGWFVTYAIIQGWIGPMGRITLGIIFGALMLILGEWRIRSYVQQGSVFLVIGSTIILLTIFAARELYDFFTPVSALMVMFASVGFAAFSSVVHNRQPLALASIILAGIAPLLTGSSEASYLGLFSYLLIVVMGTLWVVAITGWRALIMAGLLVVSFYSLPHLVGIIESVESQGLLFFAFLFSTIFFLTNTAGILKSKDGDITADAAAAGGTGIFLIAWIMRMVSPQWQSLVLAAWMIVFIGGAYSIFAITKKKQPFYIYACVALGMLVAATAAELSGPVLTLAYIVESVLVVLISYTALRDIKITQTVSWLLIGPAFLSLTSFMAYNWREGVLHDDFFVLFVMSAALFLLGTFFFTLRNREGSEGIRNFYSTIFTIGSVYALSLYWLSLHAGMENEETATMISLITFTIVGLITYIRGKLRNKRGLLIYGGVLTGLVVARLLLVEVWEMELTGRIVTFFIIGALLMSTAFIGRKPKEVKVNQPILP